MLLSNIENKLFYKRSWIFLLLFCFSRQVFACESLWSALLGECLPVGGLGLLSNHRCVSVHTVEMYM